MARSTFTKHSGSTFNCESCGRRTRNTGEQAIGSKLCPQCWELAGIDNEISDGATTQANIQHRINDLFEEIREKGGDPLSGFAGLAPAPTTRLGFGVTLYATGNNRAEPQLQFVGATIEEAREYMRQEIAKARAEHPDWTFGESFGDEYAECKAFGFTIRHGEFA